MEQNPTEPTRIEVDYGEIELGANRYLAIGTKVGAQLRRAGVLDQIAAMFFPTKEPHTPKPKPPVGTPVHASANHRRRVIRQLAIERRTTPKRIARAVDRNPRNGLGRELNRRLEQAGA